MRELHLFAGSGGGILGGMLLGHSTVCAVEIEPYCRKVLLQRQRDGILPRFPIWDDVRTFDGRPWRGKVDVVCAGIPCQTVSAAGNGGGFIGQDYYTNFLRIIRESGPGMVFLENSPLLSVRGLGCVLWDLAEMGLHARWGALGALDVGRPHKRERMWILATDPKRYQQSREKSCIRSAGRMGRKREYLEENRDWEAALSEIRGMDDGLARSVDRTDSIRNGQVPEVAALAWRILTDFE